jgi:hypothetical protein
VANSGDDEIDDGTLGISVVLNKRPFHLSQVDFGSPIELAQFRPLRIVVDNHDAAVQWLHLSDMCGTNLSLGHRATSVRWLLEIEMEEPVE